MRRAVCGAAGFMGQAVARLTVSAAVIGVLAASTGCAPVTTHDGERLPVRSDRFADYVERVFREQNRVATTLAFAVEDELEPERLDALEAVEAALISACAGLNALASARRDGDGLGPVQSLRAARSAPECEAATARAEELVAEG